MVYDEKPCPYLPRDHADTLKPLPCLLLVLLLPLFAALQEIHNMLKENNKVLKCSNASPDWRGYVDFVNNVVVDGLSRVICASLEYLLDQVIAHTHTSPE